jgi:hypothetical protein
VRPQMLYDVGAGGGVYARLFVVFGSCVEAEVYRRSVQVAVRVENWS